VRAARGRGVVWYSFVRRLDGRGAAGSAGTPWLASHVMTMSHAHYTSRFSKPRAIKSEPRMEELFRWLRDGSITRWSPSVTTSYLKNIRNTLAGLQAHRKLGQPFPANIPFAPLFDIFAVADTPKDCLSATGRVIVNLISLKTASLDEKYVIFGAMVRGNTIDPRVLDSVKSKFLFFFFLTSFPIDCGVVVFHNVNLFSC
jgi:hypothetical protein